MSAETPRMCGSWVADSGSGVHFRGLQDTMDGPNPLRALLSMLRARRLRRPDFAGSDRVDHGKLDPILDLVARGGVAALDGAAADLSAYITALGLVDPDTLSRAEGMAYWLNLYNAGALDLTRRSHQADTGTVLRVPGAFDRPFVQVAGEDLSLDGIEHGKIRRLGSPRIHAALVCGSASCPTLRFEAYRGPDVDGQLEDQLVSWLRAGAADADRQAGVLRLSRVFLWYGSDFVRPHRMPTLIPASKRSIRKAVEPWLSEQDREWVAAVEPAVEFQSYDWSLACTVR